MSFSSTTSTRVGSIDEKISDDEKKIIAFTGEPKDLEDAVPIPVEDGAAWLRVLAAFLIFVMTWGPSNGIGAFTAFYQTDLLSDCSPSQIAWIGSTQTFLIMSVGVISGPLFDQGHLKVLMPLGCFLCVLAFMLLSLATEFYQVFLAQGVLFGLGTGIAYVPSMAMVSVRFHKHRAIAMGLANAGSSVGGIIFPTLIRNLVPRVGFAWTARTIGFIQIVISILALSIILRDGELKKPRRKLFQLEAFTELPFSLFSVAYFLQNLGYWIPFGFLSSYAIIHLKASANLGFYILAATNATSILGRILPCFVAQRVGAFNVFLTSVTLCTIIIFSWLACQDVKSFIAFCLIWGFVSGSSSATAPVVAASKPMSPSIEVTGTRLGMIWLMGGTGILIGNPIAGSLIDVQSGDYMKLQVFGGAIMATAACLFIWPWVVHERIRKTEPRK